MKSLPVHLRVHPVLHSQLEAHARATGMTMTHIVRQALIEYFQTREFRHDSRATEQRIEEEAARHAANPTPKIDFENLPDWLVDDDD